MNKSEKLELSRKIILVESDSNWRKLLAQNLELYTGSEIILKSNADEVTEFLKDNEDVGLIISENMVGEEYTILKIYYYINSNKYNIPIILLGENPKIAGEVTMMEKEDWKLIVKEAAKLLTITAESMSEMQVPKYYPISIRSLLEMKSLPVTIFEVNDGNYSTLIKANQEIHKGKLQSMMTNGVSHLFINHKVRLKFANAFSAHISTILESMNLDKDERVAITGTAFDSAATILQEVGMSDEAAIASRETINSMLEICRQSHSLNDLIDILQRDNDSYLYRHSLMISIISHHVISHMEWGNEDQKNKICFAAFFHDITISDDELCTIHSKEELDNSCLDDDTKERVKNHALKAYELLEKYPHVPIGAEDIILKHHGAMGGIGFPAPESFDSRISRLAIAFRVVEDYAHQILCCKGDKVNVEPILQNLKERYNKGQYRKVFEALDKAHN